jgi:hypothetical protein
MGGMVERSTPPARGAVIPVLRVAASLFLASAPATLHPGRAAAGEGAAAERQGAVAAERTATAQDPAAELISGLARGLGDQRDVPAEGVRRALDAVLRALDRMASRAPADPRLPRLKVVALGEFSAAYAALGDTDRQLASAAEALAIAERLAERNPGGAEEQRDLAAGHNRVGDVLAARGDLPGAVAAYRAGLAAAERLAAAPGPGNAQRRQQEAPAPAPSPEPGEARPRQLAPAPEAAAGPAPPPDPPAPAAAEPGKPPAASPGGRAGVPPPDGAFAMPMPASVRAGPGGSAPVLRPVSKGTAVRVFARSGSWLEIGDGEPWGWVHDSRAPASARQRPGGAPR